MGLAQIFASEERIQYVHRHVCIAYSLLCHTGSPRNIGKCVKETQILTESVQKPQLGMVLKNDTLMVLLAALASHILLSSVD